MGVQRPSSPGSPKAMADGERDLKGKRATSDAMHHRAGRTLMASVTAGTAAQGGLDLARDGRRIDDIGIFDCGIVDVSRLRALGCVRFTQYAHRGRMTERVVVIPEVAFDDDALLAVLGIAQHDLV